MHESIEHAIDDMQVREGIELRNKAQAMVRGTRKALELSDLPADQTWSIKQGIKKIDKLLKAGAPSEELNAAVEDVSKLTAQVADDIIGSAVKKALSE